MSRIVVKLKPQKGIRYKEHTYYLFDPDAFIFYINLAKDWAIKLDGKVVENEEEVDYSSKFYAIESKQSATESATSAADSLASSIESQRWAIGSPTEPVGNSAKYWAGISEDYANQILNMQRTKHNFIIGTPSEDYDGSLTDYDLGRDLTDASVEVYWNGQYLVDTNYTISGSVVSMDFTPTAGGTMAFIVNDKARMVEMGDLSLHENDPLAHKTLFDQKQDAFTTGSNVSLDDGVLNITPITVRSW